MFTMGLSAILTGAPALAMISVVSRAPEVRMMCNDQGTPLPNPHLQQIRQRAAAAAANLQHDQEGFRERQVASAMRGTTFVDDVVGGPKQLRPPASAPPQQKSPHLQEEEMQMRHVEMVRQRQAAAAARLHYDQEYFRERPVGSAVRRGTTFFDDVVGGPKKYWQPPAPPVESQPASQPQQRRPPQPQERRPEQDMVSQQRRHVELVRQRAAAAARHLDCDFEHFREAPVGFDNVAGPPNPIGRVAPTPAAVQQHARVAPAPEPVTPEALHDQKVFCDERSGVGPLYTQPAPAAEDLPSALGVVDEPSVDDEHYMAGMDELFTWLQEELSLEPPDAYASAKVLFFDGCRGRDDVAMLVAADELSAELPKVIRLKIMAKCASAS